MLHKKRFKDNRSAYPTQHKIPIDRLLELNHPMVPKIIEYDDKKITYEYVEGIALKETSMRSVEDMMWVLSECMDFMNTLTGIKTLIEKKFPENKELFLFADDIHSLNLIITPDRQLKIIDLDMIGFFHKKDVYRYLNRNYFYIVDFFRCRNYT